MARRLEEWGPVFDAVSDGICASDSEGRIVYLNPAAERILGAPLSRVRGNVLCELLCGKMRTAAGGDCASACPLRDPAGAATGVTTRGERAAAKSYGWGEESMKRLERARSLRVRCLNAVGKAGRLTVIEDVSAEAELERRKEAWRNMVAHDLRNPLTAVYGALRELQEGGGAGSQPELVAMAARGCLRMKKLLEVYLDLAKLEAGRMPVRTEPVGLGALAEACAAEQAPLARQRRIAVACAVEPGLRVSADAELLGRVVRNLLDNALKFTPEGGHVTLCAKAEQGGVACLCVEDSGPGIAPEELPRLFDPYHQAADRRAGKSQGTGLGLAFCREALKVMGGSIAVESALGAGSRFLVWLPAAV